MRKGCAVITVLLAGLTFAFGTDIYPGLCLKSPDGRFVARCEGGGVVPTVDSLKISELTSSRSELVSILSPAYSVAWTGDSKTILTVGHIAGGTEASVIHFEDGKWKQYNAEPGEGDRYEVVRQVLRKHAIELTYKINIVPKSSDQSGRMYLYSFIFDPTTTRHTNEKRKEIDPATYVRLRLRTEFDYSKP